MTKFLGLTVRDAITGLAGIAQSHVVLINGNERYNVQPPGDGKTIADAYEIDEHSLVHVEDGPTVQVILPADKISAGLGDHVRDLLSGREGIVHYVMTSVNGCVYLGVTERADQIGDKIVLKDTMLHTHDRFELVEAGAFARLRAEADTKKKGLLTRAKEAVSGKKPAREKEAPPAEVPRRPPGGPTTRAIRV